MKTGQRTCEKQKMSQVIEDDLIDNQRDIVPDLAEVFEVSVTAMAFKWLV